MCGRYAIISEPDVLRSAFGYIDHPNFPARYNVAPTQPVPVVFQNGHGDKARRFSLVRWGFLPGFVKDPRPFPLILNARAEGIADKPSFRNAVRRRRCLFMADGWYEWRGQSGPQGKAVKQPFLIRRRDLAPFGIAGLYETWSDPSGGEIDTGCLITTSASASFPASHDRMPAIIAPGDYALWLDCADDRCKEALALLLPAPEEAFEFFAVSHAVNNARAEGPDLQTALGTGALF